MRFELTTSSLPRKCSTPELQQLLFAKLLCQWNIFPEQLCEYTKFHPKTCFSMTTFESGRRVSNSQPIAWKAIALPIELLPLFCGQWWIRTTEVERQRIYSPPHLATLVTALSVLFKVRYILLLNSKKEPKTGVEPATY